MKPFRTTMARSILFIQLFRLYIFISFIFFWLLLTVEIQMESGRAGRKKNKQKHMTEAMQEKVRISRSRKKCKWERTTKRRHINNVA